MKSYSVKSNAKRFARGLAAKNQSLEVVEPVETEDGSGEWLPVVKVVGEADKLAIFRNFRDVAIIYGLALDSVLAAEANGEGDAGVYAVPPDDIGEVLANEDAVIAAEGIRPEDGVDVSQMVGTVVIGEGGDVATAGVYIPVDGWTAGPPVRSQGPAADADAGDADWTTGPAVRHRAELVSQADMPDLTSMESGITVDEAAFGSTPVFEASDMAGALRSFHENGEVTIRVGTIGRKPAPDDVEEGDEADEPLSPAEAGAVVAALAALPPRVERTKAEIAEAREERRARIKAGEYKTPAVAATKDVKVPKSTLVYEAIKADGGASFVDLIALTDWQKHTLRGYIAGTLRKRAKAEGLEIEAFKVKGEPTRYRALPA